MLFAIGTMKPSVDMVGRLPEKHRHYNDPCEIRNRNLFYCSQSKPTNTHGTYCTFFDATPTSLCTVYCIVACPYDLGNGNNPMWASTPARHDCFTDASHTQADGAFILQRKRLLYCTHCAYISSPVPQTFVPKHRETEACWNHELEAEATTTQANGAEATATEANGAEATTKPKQQRSRSNRNKQEEAEATTTEAKSGHLHSAGSPWRAFANPKACFLILSTSFESPGLSKWNPFVLDFPAESTHRHTIRWLRLS